jgi:hypothetical protein
MNEADDRQSLMGILSDLPCGPPGTLRACADAEIKGITNKVVRARMQGELMRVVGARVITGETNAGVERTISGNVSGDRLGGDKIGGGEMNILPRHFNPGVGLV